MTCVSLGLCLVFWQFIVWVLEIPPYILPAPWDIFKSFINNAALIRRHMGFSALEIVLGLVTGILASLFLGSGLHFMPRVRRFVMPFLVACQSIPMFALLPLMSLWLGQGWAAKITVVGLSVYFPVVIALLEGLSQVPQAWHEQARLLQAHRWRKFRYLEFPYALPQLFSGLKVAFAMAPLAVLASDWIGADAGLGYLILYSAGRLEFALMFACIFTLSALALLGYQTLQIVQKRLISWPF